MRTGLVILIWLASQGAVQAQSLTRIPGSQVSYRLRTEGGNNRSVVLLSSTSEPSGNTFLALSCLSSGGTDTVFALDFNAGTPLAAGPKSAVLRLEDSTRARESQGKLLPNNVDGKYTLWTSTDAKAQKDVSLMLLSAVTPLKLSVKVAGVAKPTVYRFDNRGLLDGLKAVKECRNK